MIIPSSQFDAETAISLTAANIFEAQIHSSWWVGRGPNGGYLAAIILRALQQTLADETWQPISLTIHYAAPPAEGRCQIITTIERRGRTLTTFSARLMQNDRLCALALAAFSLPRHTSFTYSDKQMPVVATPEQLPVFAPPQEIIPPFALHYDYRWAIGDLPFTGSAHARVGGWMRLREPRPTDALSAAAFIDGWIPAIFPVLSRPEAAPTLDLTIHFRARLPLATTGQEDFILGMFTSHFATGGYFEEDGELWSADGVLLAQSRQLALLNGG